MSVDMEKLLDSVKHVESGGNPTAVSPKGAMGPYQFMPKTAEEYGLKDPFNEEQARDAARRKLTNLINFFDGDVEKAVISYNGGEGRLQRNNGDITKMPKESQDYLSRVMSHYGNLAMASGATQFDNQDQEPVSAVDELFPGSAANRERVASGALFPNNHEDDVLRKSVLDPTPIDQASRIYNLQLRTGLPTGLIERNLDELEQKTKENDFDPEAFRRQSPLLAEWLSKNPTRSSLAQGDYENLSALEQSWASLKAIPSGFGQGADEERLMTLGYKAVTGEITPGEEQERQALKETLRIKDQENNQGLPSWIKAASKVVGQQAMMLNKSAEYAVKYGVPMGAIAGAGLGVIGGPGAPATVPAGAILGAGYGLQAGATASYIDQTYKLSVGEAYDDLESATDAAGNKINPVAAKYASMIVAVPNALLEFASTRTAVKAIPGIEKLMGKLSTQEMKQILVRPSVMEAMKDFGKKYAEAVGTETFTEGFQKFLTIIGREVATGDNGAGVTGQDAKDIVSESTQAFKASVVLGALASGPRVIELYGDMEKAAQNEEFMHSLGDVANNSATFKNSPKAFGDYVKHLKDNNGIIKNVFVPIDSWNLLFQDGAPNAAREVFGDDKQYQEAQVTGSDLVIPIETYAEKLAGTQFHEKLVPHIRLNPGEMTPTEAAEFADSEPAVLAGLEAETTDLISKEQPLSAVYQDVYGKLRQSGASKQEAERDATLWRERIRTRAARLGVDPVQLYMEQPLTVVRELPAGVVESLKVYNQQLAETPVPFAQKLPLEGGEINLPPAKEEERRAAIEAIDAGTASQKDYGVFGATIHPTKGNLSGTEGVAVAGYPQRGVVTQGVPTAKELEIFQRRNRDIFQADPNAAVGVWVDSDTGKGYIDITNVLPREQAIAQGEMLGELAVWDLGKGEEIRLPTQADAGQGVLFQSQVETTAFKKWFGDSVVREPMQNSKQKAQAMPPMVVYHGTQKNFDSFKSSSTGINTTTFGEQETTRHGIFFAENPDFASTFATQSGAQGANVMPVYLNIRNPMYLDEGFTDDIRAKLESAGLPDTKSLRYVKPENAWVAFEGDRGAALVAAAKAAGYDGAYIEEEAVGLGDNVEPQSVWVAFNSSQVKSAMGNNGAFDPSNPSILNQGERGASVPIQNLIALLKGADASTFLHESGHIWLEELRADAIRPDAPEQLKADWNAIKEWSGATDESISTDAHEMFARGMEAYVMEGKAPSFQLRRVFAQLKDWLKRIYKSMDMLDVQLTQDVRDVMDRLIATDDAIRQAHQRNGYDIKLLDETSMSGDEYAAYSQLAEEAKMKAEDNFRAKIMKELRREKLQAWRDEKKALTPQVREEILAQPIRRASYWLWSGVLPDGSEIEGMSATKLDTQTLIDMGVSPTLLPFRHQKNGLHPDVVAELFGFPSGEAMVHEMIGLEPLNKTINDEVNRQIREKHGGIIVEGTSEEEIAMEVQNTQQVDMFNMELRILKRMGAKREITHGAVLKDIAQQIISRKTLGELDPRLFEEAALRASQEAQDAMLGHEFRMGTGRNLDVAFDAKQKQMLNVFLFKEAQAQRQAADKAIKVWKKMLFRSDERLAKTHDMNMVNSARAIASVHGLGGSADTAASYMRALAQYAPDTYNDMREIVELASSDGRTFDDLTVADFSIVRDAIDGLMTLARRSRQIEIDGKKLEKDEVIGELNTRIGELVKPDKTKAGYQKAISNWDKTKMGFLGVFGMLRRVEHWVDAMDNGAADGVFRKYIWQPVSEAADKYRDSRRLTLEKYEAIAKSVPKETFKAGKIDAPELNYIFRDKTELIGALLHTGNQSNLSKLLRGREWGVLTPEGELDTRNWDAFINRMHEQGVITESDYNFIQDVWNLLDELKPGAQKAHKEMYGFFFDEVTAQPINTPWGQYAGGYYPAMVDPYIVEDAAIRADQQAVESRPSSFMFPTTGRGFTKKRTELYAKPLTLDVGLIPQSIEKVLRFTHLEPRVKDVGRVAIDKNFRNHLSDLDSEVATSMLMPWLQRSALQLVEQPSGPRMRQLDAFFHGVRTNTGLQLMAANISVALQQVSGMSLSLLKVKPRFMAGALWRYMSAPRDYTSHVNESSTFMRNRLSSQVMDIHRSIDNIMLNPSKFQKAKAFFNEHGYFMQTGMQNIVDMVTWGGAYEQATRLGADEKSAVRQADSAVRETQGTFHAEDVSRFEAGPAYLRVFTMFYSYFNMAANLNATEFVKSLRLNGFSAGGRALYIYALGFMLPAVIGEAIVQAVSGEAFDDDDDDGYLDNILSIFFGGQSKMATAMVPILGPMTQTGINMFNDKWYDDRITVSPAISSISSVVSLPYDAYKLATDEEAALKRPIKDVLTTVGMVTGLPVAPLAKPLGYLTDIQQGKIEDPENPVEFTRGLISGKAPK